ncbi:hypothetical protein ACF0H5_000016 [Mactra antiquata]
MAEVQNSELDTRVENNDNDTNEKTMTFNIAKKKDKPSEGWQNPVSSARSAIDKFWSRSDSNDKSSSILTSAAADVNNKNARKSKRRKASYQPMVIF